MIAFVISDFENITNANNDYIIFARKDLINDAKYALRETEFLLKELKNYTEIKLNGIPKMQIALIPEFEIAGMENMGLFTVLI